MIFMSGLLEAGKKGRNKKARGEKRNPGLVTPDASRRVSQRGGEPGGAANETLVRDMESGRGLIGGASSQRMAWLTNCANDKRMIILRKGSCAEISSRAAKS